MRFIRRNIGQPPTPSKMCAFGCGKEALDVQIGDFKIQACRSHVDQALDMYLATRKAVK